MTARSIMDAHQNRQMIGGVTSRVGVVQHRMLEQLNRALRFGEQIIDATRYGATPRQSR